MKIKPEDFHLLVNKAMRADNVSHMRPVIEKELLHYDILFTLESNGLLDNLTFQGGTSLRLCYGGNRYSEDLDFAGGSDFSSAMLANMKSCIEGYLGHRYGLEVRVKEPNELKKDPKYRDLRIDKWQISVVTSPERKDLPQQKIKVEVANIPAYTKDPKPLQVNYDFLPDGYGDMLILTETLDEIMADKVVALPSTTRYIRYRDIWDLAWLQQQGAKLDMDLVRNKVTDYRIERFDEILEQFIEKIPDIVSSKTLTLEMQRFLPSNVFDRTLSNSKFSVYLGNTLKTLFQSVHDDFKPDELQGIRSSLDFKM